jgi:hypothetical protein
MLLLSEANGVVNAFCLRKSVFIVVVLPWPAAGDEEDAKEGE